MRTLQRPFAMVLFVLSVLPAAGCAVAHRYPAYRGRVLEVGTDKPIDGAGVLAVYGYRQFGVIEIHSAYLGYQAVLTNKDGQFEVPAVWFTELMPFSWFDNNVSITIYKKGYGNFPGSMGGKYVVKRAKQGRAEPELGRENWVPPSQEVTFWLPKLETDEEMREHDRIFSPVTTDVLDEKGFPPPGTRRGQFLPPKYTGEGR